MSNVVPNIGYEILNAVEISYNKEQKFTDEILLSLHSVFGEVFTRSIDLLESGKFTLYQSSNGLRKLLKVKSRSEEYTLFYNINFCPCLAFKYQVLNTRSYLSCKHVLASKLADITGKLTVETITPEQISEVMKCQYPFDS